MNFLHTLSFLCIIFYTSTSAPSNSSLSTNDSEPHFARIVGGFRPQKLFYENHIVSLRYGDDKKIFGSNHFCGGAIINQRSILTAAHCVVDQNNNMKVEKHIKVVAGITDRLKHSPKEQILTVKKIKVHPDYSYQTNYADLAVLVLKDNIVEDGVHIQRVEIEKRPPEPEKQCTFYGWGAVVFNGPVADELVYINVTLATDDECEENVDVFTKGLVCTGSSIFDPKFGGNGDSGGPLICHNKLVGVASFVTWGYTFYASTYYFRDWIEASRCNGLYRGNLKLILLCLIFIFAVRYAKKNKISD